MFKALYKFLNLILDYILLGYVQKHPLHEGSDSLALYHSPTDGRGQQATKDSEIGVAVYRGEVLELRLKRGSRSHPGHWVVRRLSQNSPPHIRELARTIASLLSQNHTPDDTQFVHEQQYSQALHGIEPDNSSCLQISSQSQPPAHTKKEEDSNGVSQDTLNQRQPKVQEGQSNPYPNYKANGVSSQHQCTRTDKTKLLTRSVIICIGYTELVSLHSVTGVL